MNHTLTASSKEEATIKYVCGIDIASQSCSGCICRPDKSVVVKSMDFANAKPGWSMLLDKLSQLNVPANQILIGMEATSRYWENLYHELEQRGYQLCLLHPRQTHQFHEQQGLRAKTDRLDAKTIARVVLSGEARAGYVPSDQVAAYRELVRLHTHLSDEAARYQNEIQSLVVVLFPEFTQVTARPCLPNAMAVLKAYPHAQAIVETGVEPIFHLLHSVSPPHYGRPTAEKLVALARQSASSRRALAGRAISLQVICDQLGHTRENLARLEAEIEHLLADDPGVKGLRAYPRVWSQNYRGPACRTGGCGSLCSHRSNHCLRRDGYRDQRKWTRGLAKPNSLNGAVQRYAAPIPMDPPSEPITITSWHAVSTKARL